MTAKGLSVAFPTPRIHGWYTAVRLESVMVRGRTGDKVVPPWRAFIRSAFVVGLLLTVTMVVAWASAALRTFLDNLAYGLPGIVRDATLWLADEMLPAMDPILHRVNSLRRDGMA
jgi:hypothetical protein